MADYLLQQTVVVDRDRSVCGNCGQDPRRHTLPRRLPQPCRARWRFVTNAPGRTHRDDATELFPRLQYRNPGLYDRAELDALLKQSPS